MTSRVLSTANQITLLRLIFVPIFAILVVGRHDLGALIVLGVAAVSDAADGLVARHLHQESALGVALDPIADKALMTTAYLTLAFSGALPWWLTIVVISRDAAILMTAAAISLVAGYRPFRPTLLGKTSTTVQVATVLVALGSQAGLSFVRPVVVQIAVDLTAFFTVASGIHYLIVGRHRFAHPAQEEPGVDADSPKVRMFSSRR
jgi:cardiolipin synthase (CMP-forming)